MHENQKTTELSVRESEAGRPEKAESRTTALCGAPICVSSAVRICAGGAGQTAFLPRPTFGHDRFSCLIEPILHKADDHYPCNETKGKILYHKRPVERQIPNEMQYDGDCKELQEQSRPHNVLGIPVTRPTFSKGGSSDCCPCNVREWGQSAQYLDVVEHRLSVNQQATPQGIAGG
jgi:hypothetical protein